MAGRTFPPKIRSDTHRESNRFPSTRRLSRDRSTFDPPPSLFEVVCKMWESSINQTRKESAETADRANNNQSVVSDICFEAFMVWQVESSGTAESGNPNGATPGLSDVGWSLCRKSTRKELSPPSDWIYSKNIGASP